MTSKHLVCFAWLFGIFTACKNSQELQTPESFKVFHPLIIDTVYTTEYVAEIHALQNVEVRTRIKGFIEAIHADEGQSVQKGQILFSISNLEYQQELQKAKAAIKSALAELRTGEIELENTLKLLEKNIVSKAELKMVESKVEALKAKVEQAQSDEAQAQLNLSFTEIKAPFDGIINRIPNKTGSLVEEGSLLTTISNNKEVLVYFNLSERDYLEYKSNDSVENSKIVELEMVNNQLYEHKGKIEIIESEFDQSTGNIAFRARFPNPDNLLRHGSNGKIIVTKKLKNAILIPQKSTFEIQDKLYVFTVGKDSLIHQKNITSSLRIPHYYIVSSGISKEDVILFEGLQMAKEGMKINPILTSIRKTDLGNSAESN